MPEIEGTKRCTICRAVKQLNEFHRRADSPDGHRSMCKDCRKLQSRDYYEANTSTILAKNKEYHAENREQLVDKMSARYYADRDTHLQRTRDWAKKNPRLVGGYRRKWIAANPLKNKAHTALNTARKAGLVKAPIKCEVCNTKTKLQGHHWSYAPKDWLDVQWVCSQCHKDIHKILDEKEGL